MSRIREKLEIERLLLVRLRRDLLWDWDNKPYFYHFILMKLIVLGDFLISFMFRWILINVVPIPAIQRFYIHSRNNLQHLLYDVFEKFLVYDIYGKNRR